MKKLSLLHDEFLTEVRGKYPEAYPRLHTNDTPFLVVDDLFTDFCFRIICAGNKYQCRSNANEYCKKSFHKNLPVVL